jgi:hypothetical protein
MIWKHEVAFWAAVFAFFGSLIAVGIFDVLNPDQWLQYIGALLVAFITGGSVYAKERLEEAKKEKEKEEMQRSSATTLQKKKKDE